MFSMTGYGRGQVSHNGMEIMVEIRTVNNRYLDINCKLPKIFFAFEDAVRKAVSAKVMRGRVDLYISYQDNRDAEREVSLDGNLAKGYIKAAHILQTEYGVQNDLTAAVLLRFPDVVRLPASEENLDIMQQLLIDCTKTAVDNLNDMRQAEGAALKKDISMRVENMQSITREIAVSAPVIAEQYRQKLTERMQQILSGVEVDESKLLTEAAFYADRSNIDEELSRLQSHYIQFKKILASDDPAGRKLDFLVQELNRESNTVCSKSNDVNITELGLLLKSEIEKIREQVQNIE